MKIFSKNWEKGPDKYLSLLIPKPIPTRYVLGFVRKLLPDDIG